jgi:two-component system, OmpR family, sensor kinase
VPISEQKSKVKRELLKLPYFVLTFSLLVTIGVTYLFYTSSEGKDAARFKQEVVQIDTSINNRMRTYVAILKGGRGFVETVGEINRQNFRRFVSSLDLKRNYAGVQGIGYAKRVLSYEGESLAQLMESEGFTNFQIFPHASKYEYIAILYLEPLDERNRRAIGFDMASEPIRRQAMDQARDTGEAVMTGKVFLVQETEEDRQPGFLIYVPVYKGDMNPPTVEDRRRSLDGFVFSPFRAKNFLNDIRNSSGNDEIAITIYDGEMNPENILAQTHENISSGVNDLITQTEIGIAGRKWTVEYRALPEFVAKSSSGWTLLIFISGLIFSLLLFGITYLESIARSRLEQNAMDLRESEREKAQLYEKEQKARRLAEGANRAKDEFISVVSHELRTPLNSIAGWTRILQSETLAPQMKEQALEKIEKNLRAQTRLVEELLDFSQIITGKADLRLKPVEISDIFESAYAEAEKDAEDKGVNINKENTLNGQKVAGDPERLKKALENVMRNAVKFTPSDGKIDVTIEERDGTVELRVRDSGQGINPKFLPHIFEGFRQADSSSTRQYGGLGLGLAISRHIFELHGGTIKAESAGEGKGSLFVIKIPVQKKQNELPQNN